MPGVVPGIDQGLPGVVPPLGWLSIALRPPWLIRNAAPWTTHLIWPGKVPLCWKGFHAVFYADGLWAGRRLGGARGIQGGGRRRHVPPCILRRSTQPCFTRFAMGETFMVVTASIVVSITKQFPHSRDKWWKVIKNNNFYPRLQKVDPGKHFKPKLAD